MGEESIVIFMAGDVMTGRGVDQVLPSPGKPELREQYVRDARGYVELAERVNGPIPRPVDASWPWGDALAVLDAVGPDVRLVNLETAVTSSDDFAAGKAVNYRMDPRNVACLTVARLDVCALANNHVLDFGVRGLEETLDTLAGAGLGAVGAGRDAEQAWRPRVVPIGDGHGRVLVWSVATTSSGVPRSWAASDDRPGVALLTDLSDDVAEQVTEEVQRVRGVGDVVVVSVHWGSNWGYDVPDDQQRFAHRLLDAGVDVVHGHSSHHPRPLEVYRNKLVLYGCGDLIDDYEGISGHERFRADLRLLYFASVDPRTGELQALRMVPMQVRRMRLHHAAASDAEWLRDVLNRTSARFGSHIDLQPDGSLALRWA